MYVCMYYEKKTSKLADEAWVSDWGFKMTLIHDIHKQTYIDIHDSCLDRPEHYSIELMESRLDKRIELAKIAHV